METNSVILAPQLENVEEAFGKWVAVYGGSREAFYRFMVTPSHERTRFIDMLHPATEFMGSFAAVVVKDSGE